MDDLRTRVAELESELRRLRAEWSDVLDRFTRMGERQRKREERQERSEAGDPTPITAKPTKAALWARLNRTGVANGTS